tara:strand:+ start:39 stop:461 length:423 start_codon:yes stop_codon:yes gene_type:complete
MMYDRYCQGYSIEEVAKESGRSRQTVHKMFQRRGYELRPVRGPARDGVAYGGKSYSLGSTGYMRCTTGARELLHRLIWADINGPIPDGYDIHHRDHNKLNNDPANLQLLSKSDHAALHAALEEVVPLDSPTVDVLTAGYP